jgi:hypothetical protein
VSTTSIKRKTYLNKKRKEKRKRKEEKTLRKLHRFHFPSSNNKR